MGNRVASGRPRRRLSHGLGRQGTGRNQQNQDHRDKLHAHSRHETSDADNYESRCTVSMENAGAHTAMYSAPPSSGVKYCTHSPPWTTTACPDATSISPPLCRTRNVPLSTTVYSSNSGVCPGSSHPCGLRMWATLTAEVFELTRPMYSSISLGLLPAAAMRVGCAT